MESDKQSSLPPIDFSDDIENLDAHVEEKEVKFSNCNHINVAHKEGKLICTCGAGWQGPGLNTIYTLFKSQKL